MVRLAFERNCRALLCLVGLAAGCSDSDPALPSRAACGAIKPAPSATALACPFQDKLPFHVGFGFDQAANATVESTEGCSKDEAADSLGNMGGVTASIYLADEASPSAAALPYHGTKARTSQGSGLLEDALPGETVSLWFYDTGTSAWRMLGSGETDHAGAYDITVDGFVAPNGQPVYGVLEADGSCAEHFDYRLPAGKQVVVSDIDGTLTANDGELIKQASDETYVPAKMGGAVELTQAWAAKGYPVIYLTARPHSLRPESRIWLSEQGFAAGPLITEGGTKPAEAYKTLWLNRMVQNFGWKIVAAYGNADTDITAYAAAGIDAKATFIVGPLAGNRGTQPIANMDFTSHIAAYVNAQPTNP